MLLLSGLHFSKIFNTTKILHFQSPKSCSDFCAKVFDFLGEPAFNYAWCFWGYRTETVFHPAIWYILSTGGCVFWQHKNLLLIKELGTLGDGHKVLVWFTILKNLSKLEREDKLVKMKQKISIRCCDRNQHHEQLANERCGSVLLDLARRGVF